MACGPFWFTCMGGAELNRHVGPRREFLIIGKGLLDAAECLEEAPIGTVVVSSSCYEAVQQEYELERTPQGNYKIIDGFGNAILPPPQTPDKPNWNVWTTLRLFCHEGARDLQVRVTLGHTCTEGLRAGRENASKPSHNQKKTDKFWPRSGEGLACTCRVLSFSSVLLCLLFLDLPKGLMGVCYSFEVSAATSVRERRVLVACLFPLLCFWYCGHAQCVRRDKPRRG